MSTRSSSALLLTLAFGMGCGGGAATDGGGVAARDSGRAGHDAGGTEHDAGERVDASPDAGDTTVTRTPVAYVGLTSGDLLVLAIDAGAGTVHETSRARTGNFPSFMAAAPDGRTLYVVHEASQEAAALTVTPGTGAVSVQNRRSTQGASPTHVAVSRDGRYVFTANYGGGSFTTFETMADGGLGDASTKSPSSQVHEVVLDTDGTHLYVPCKGSDRVAQYALGPSGVTPLSPSSVSFSSGSGPRHMVVDEAGSHAYVIHELGSAVTVHPRMTDGTLGAESQRLSTLPGGFGGSNSTAEILMHPNGRFVYGTNRGHDSVVIFRVRPGGDLELVDHESARGDTPRSMALTPDGSLLLVANQSSRDVQVFSVDPNAGTLTHRSSMDTDADAFFVGVFSIPDA